MPMIVTKAQIIEAIRTEPLKAGSWIELYSEYEVPALDPATCPVCAVGGVLRRMGVPPDQVSPVARRATRGEMIDTDYAETVAEVYDHADEQMRAARPLNALSVAFEGLCGLDLGMGEVRDLLETYVRDEFPDSIAIPYDPTTNAG